MATAATALRVESSCHNGIKFEPSWGEVGARMKPSWAQLESSFVQVGAKSDEILANLGQDWVFKAILAPRVKRVRLTLTPPPSSPFLGDEVEASWRFGGHLGVMLAHFNQKLPVIWPGCPT